MKKTQTQIQIAVREILAQTIERSPMYADKLRGIRVRVSTRMTNSGGTASYHKNEITISLPFFADPGNFDNELFEVVTHEAAHLIVGLQGRNGRPHGPQFRLVHRSIGGTGRRTHTMQLAEGFKARSRQSKVEVLCHKCGKPLQLGPVQIKRHLSGRGRYSHHRCPR